MAHRAVIRLKAVADDKIAKSIFSCSES